MVEGAPLSDLNTLALELSNLDTLRLAGLEGMLQIYREHHGSGPVPTEDLHRIINQSDQALVGENVRTDLDLGQLLYDNELLPERAAELLALSQEQPEFCDDLYIACGKQHRRESRSVFTSHGYVEPDPEFLPFLLGQEQSHDESPGMGMSP